MKENTHLRVDESSPAKRYLKSSILASGKAIVVTDEMSNDRWPSQAYLNDLSEALRLIVVSLRLVRMWLIVITTLLGLILWRMW